MIKKLFAYLHYRLFYIWLLLFSFLSVMISPEKSTEYAVISVFILLYLIYAFNQRLFTWVIIFLSITLSLYYPIYLRYGSLNSGIVAAFLETNISELLGFLERIRLEHLLFPICYILFAVILIRLKKYNKPSPYDKRKRQLYIVLSATFIFTLLFEPTRFYLGSYVAEEDRDWTLANSPVNIVSFYANIYDSITHYYQEKQELLVVSTKPSPWQITQVEPRYDNYVLIIGESARRDYLATYGFTLPTTPFLDRTNGYINAGYIASAPATYHSLLKSLYLKQTGKRDYAYNIITLAKGANFETNWFSNQGSIGKYDTIASRMGRTSDFSYFTKVGGFNTNNEDDFKLVEQLKQRLALNKLVEKRGRLFVLHLMGSHAPFCDRITAKEKQLTFMNEDMCCYVNSILKTDKLIENVVDALKSTGQSYSLIYFSDHGLHHIDKTDKQKLTLDYGEEFKSNYAVPFVKISSDDTERLMVNTKRSAFNFMYGFSQWLGIRSAELDQNYDFFSNKDDEHIKVFNFKENVEFEQLKEDVIPEFNTTISN
ncbi:phosphoethanolamine transferase [[Haemophilus] ducreyi]|uniref:phosphoethanolamine transferase n=1 Tax=Haemophilus ducreyi TaxID=730 RepID=UPI00065554B2|nr:phosphoethanolamine transferase [[Haemophilus] ducreyi]AKO49089.1 Dca [[Haemophilus] ducreyi]